MTRLQQQPPPVNYRTRRIIGADTTLLTTAVAHAATQTRPAPQSPLPVLVARFWELFTGGHISYAPAVLHPTDLAAHRFLGAGRGEIDQRYGQVFAHAYALLRTSGTLPLHGPLVWQPPWLPPAHAEPAGPLYWAATPPLPSIRREDRISGDTVGHLTAHAILTTARRTILDSRTAGPALAAAIRASGSPIAGRLDLHPNRFLLRDPACRPVTRSCCCGSDTAQVQGAILNSPYSYAGIERSAPL